MNTAEYLVKKLEELGVEDFFGLPGDYNFEILRAIENNQNTTWIGCINELNAGYAADGYARQKGFGALVTTYGVGELSAINAVAGSFAENVPVISIVGIPSTKCINNKTVVHHNFQEPNYRAFENAYKNVVETTAFLNRDNAKQEIDRVLKVLIKERKPVYIAIPIDIAKMEISDRDVDYSWESDSDNLEKAVNIIVNKINNSKKPVILADVLIKRFDAKNEFREFVENSGIPATNFMMGTGLLNCDIKNYLGSYYADFKNPTAKDYLEKTDCLIAVGSIYSDLNSYGFNLPYKINSHISIHGTYTIIENVKYENIKMTDVLEKLSEQIEKKYYEFTCEEYGYQKVLPKNEKLDSSYIYPRLQEFLKENDILYADTGIIPHGVCQMKMPNNVDLNFQTLWGSIGWATPAAFGACVANPNSRVILFTGEGAHQLTAMELGNMLRFGLKPVVIVLNNGGYTIERILSDNSDDKFNDIIQINYSKFARIFEGDVWSTKVETQDDFDKALKVTQIMNKLCYIEICTASDDAPDLIKNVIKNFKTKRDSKISSIPEVYCKSSEKVVLSKKEDMSFETTVHESLRKDN